jgi:iron complex transport system substrate-binding protein
MNRAVISATEAKTAALQDLDIRSKENPRLYGATGTGTDNIVVVSGTGRIIDNAGGHSKMGELIARAVYAGVQEAIARQNGIVVKRSVFQRLKERDISLFGLISQNECECGFVKSDLLAPLEKALMDPKYSGFVASALALSDAVGSDLIGETSSFQDSCRMVAEEIAGKKIHRMINLVAYKDLPPALHSALNALLNGVYFRMIEE